MFNTIKSIAAAVISALSFFFLSFNANARVLTVSNTGNVVAQYSSIGAAQTAASNGDTLYVSGSPNAYDLTGFTFNKSLTIIGAGYNPNNPLTTGTSLIINCCSNVITISANNFKFIGIQFYPTWSNLNINSNGYSNLTFTRCLFENTTINTTNFSNLFIQGSIFDNSSRINGNNSTSNCIISNNIFYNNAYVNNFNLSSVIMFNNTFIMSSTNNAAIQYCSYATITNNIFYNGAFFNDSYCIFNNNLAYNTNPSTLPPSGNTGIGNINGQNPLFTTIPGSLPGNFAGNYSSFNLNLQASSPGKKAGTDGTDIGIYGGSTPFPSDFTGDPNIPQMLQFDLQNTIVGSDGQLRFISRGIKKD